MKNDDIPVWGRLRHNQKKYCIAGVIVVLGLVTLVLILAFTLRVPAPLPEGTNAFLTCYGYNDNDNGRGQFGTAVIAYPASTYPTLHEIATEDYGNWTHPSTFASDNRVYDIGEVIYIPRLKKYFIHEDGCTQCTQDADKGKARVDIFIGGNDKLQNSKQLRSCQRRLTLVDDVIVRNPDRNLTVDPLPFYIDGRGCRVLE